MTAEADIQGVARAVQAFEDAFGCAPTHAGAAPGRVNVIGDHVDYCDGFVLPMSLDRSTYIVGALAPGDACEAAAAAFPGKVARFSPDDAPAEDGTAKWAMYLKGMCAIYARKGHAVPAFRAAVVSDVPLGSGLSSSAALEMATGVLIEQLAGIAVDAADRALMGQACEHEFAGVPCGIMDQLISSKGQAGHVLLIDCRTLEATPVPLDNPDVAVVVANSNVTHDLSGSEYPERRKATEDAAEAIAKEFPDAGVTHLRDATLEQLAEVAGKLDATTEMRARHVINENKRTLDAQVALADGDLETFGRLMHESHCSLRDLFEVSTTEIDGLVAMAMEVDGVYGSRITGGGFGGCAVSLVKKDAVPALVKVIEEKYPALNGGKSATVFSTAPGPGARKLPL